MVVSHRHSSYKIGHAILIPVTSDDSLGGDLAFATGLSLYAPFPAKPEWPVKLHGFINTGRVTAWDCREYFRRPC
jgi:outer membrane protein assembly factor BamA